MLMIIFFVDQNHKNKTLSEILDIKKLKDVDKQIEAANGLPNECYISEDYLAYERDKIFCDKWTVVGVGSSIPNVGDAKPYNLLGIPLIIIRSKDMKIRVFHNVCSHRGFKLLDKPCNLKNVIRCPYHSWSYDFEGNIVATPHIGGLDIHQSDKFDKNKSNLKEVKTKIWMDMIFVNINSNEIDFNEYIKPLEQRWSKFINNDDHNLLVHSKKDEEKFVNNGFGISRYDLMYNDFIIIGPSKDPAGLISKNNIKHALKSIINSDSVFVSRGDNSGTHKAELFLWDLAKINVNDFSKNHYRELGLGMGATLNVAIQMGAYVLSDRATWLAFNNKGNHKVLFQGDKNLHNQYGIIIVNPERCKNVKLQNAQKFVNWMLSTEGQKSISSFKINGQQLFFPNAK